MNKKGIVVNSLYLCIGNNQISLLINKTYEYEKIIFDDCPDVCLAGELGTGIGKK